MNDHETNIRYKLSCEQYDVDFKRTFQIELRYMHSPTSTLLTYIESSTASLITNSLSSVLQAYDNLFASQLSFP